MGARGDYTHFSVRRIGLQLIGGDTTLRARDYELIVMMLLFIANVALLLLLVSTRCISRATASIVALIGLLSASIAFYGYIGWLAIDVLETHWHYSMTEYYELLLLTSLVTTVGVFNGVASLYRLVAGGCWRI